MTKLTDRFGRTIDYLRVSVTDRCNLRCVYCMPAGGISHKSYDDILSFEEISRIVSIAVRRGVRKVRITGGEPLVRKDLPLLVKKLRAIEGIEDLAVTTNGIRLSEYAAPLKDAGLNRVNVSLDSLVPERFEEITRGGRLSLVLEGIDRLFSLGLVPVKINMVLMKGFNHDEIAAFARLARQNPIDIRFIEYMPTRFNHHSYSDLFFSAYEAKKICCRLGQLIPVVYSATSTASVYTIDGFRGTIGFIAPMTAPFCRSCNKLRLTADGLLKNCLHSTDGVDLKKRMRDGAADEDIGLFIESAMTAKPASHDLSTSPIGGLQESFSMCQIGG